nr:aminotransferase class V-fold PLP-dependent enzyme [Caldalkalibacillus mannanilyticus]
MMYTQTESSMQVSQRILLCPGPVMVSPRVKAALLHDDIGHREEEFSELLSRCRSKLNKIFGVTGNLYTNVIISGSGTSANEAILSSYGTDKRLLLVSNGEFGERLMDLAHCHQLEYIPLRLDWDKPIDLQAVEWVLSTNQYDAIMVVHHETSTGILNPIREIGELAARWGSIFWLMQCPL